MNHLLPFLVLLTVAVTATAGDDHARHHGGAHDNHTPLAADSVEHDDSLFHLGAEWRTQHGDTFMLADLEGQPTVITMIYGSCNTACPILVHDTRRIQEAIPEADRDRLQVVIVSFDPDRDSPEALADYAEERKLGEERWHFLHGEAMDIRTLAALLGVRYRDNGDGSFDHSNVITLLDPSGRIAHRNEGLMQPVEPMAERIKKMLETSAETDRRVD